MKTRVPVFVTNTGMVQWPTSRRVRSTGTSAAAPARANRLRAVKVKSGPALCSVFLQMTARVPSDERANRLARRTLGALHPNAVDKL